MDPVARLLRVARLAADPWFSDAINRHITDGAPLAEALGLNGGPGVRTARTLHRHAQRDALLAAAWRAVPGELGAIGRTRAVDAAARLIERTWSRTGTADAPPQRFNQVETLVWRARKLGLDLPKFRRLHEVCSER